MQKVEKLLGAIPQTPLGDSTPYCSTPAPWIFIRRFDVGRERPPAAGPLFGMVFLVVGDGVWIKVHPLRFQKLVVLN